MDGTVQIPNRIAVLLSHILVIACVLSCFVSVVVVIVGCIGGVGGVGGGSL